MSVVIVANLVIVEYNNGKNKCTLYKRQIKNKLCPVTYQIARKTMGELFAYVNVIC
jgi:hypothetical protein